MSSPETIRRRPFWDAAADLIAGRGRGAQREAAASAPLQGDESWGAALLESLPDPALMVVGASPDDPTGWRYVLANARAREVLRIVRPEGPLLTVLRDPQVLDTVGHGLFHEPDETAFEMAGAHERTWRVMARPLAIGEGPVRSALVILRDETDIRRADRTRADFLANASHELRTPLASLLGFIETLRGHARQDPTAREKFLGIMQSQAERMSRLIDDLMSLSRIELNEHIPPSGEADVGLAALDVLDAIAPLAADKGVRLEQTIPTPGEAMISGDRDQLVQVAQNLVENALKYSTAGCKVQVEVAVDVGSPESQPTRQEGRPRFWVLSPEHAPEQRYVTLRVNDFGPGLAREHLPRLAERFYRVEGQKSGERSGTGLGLAIVKHIVSRHHGALLVESTAGEGSTFTVFFPQGPGRAV